MQSGLTLVLIAMIAFVLMIIVFLLAATIYRRTSRGRRFRILDRKKEEFRRKIGDLFESGDPITDVRGLSSRKGSLSWEAIESVLLEFVADGRHEAKARDLFVRLGYVSHYENRIESRNTITRASAIDTLGKMRSTGSEDRIIGMLKEERSEIVSVAIRSLSKIGSQKGLAGILENMPGLLSQGRVTRKTLETSLMNYGTDSVPALIEHGERCTDPLARASILEMLSILAAREGLPLAFRCLEDGDPEVRAKALKVIGKAGRELPEERKAGITLLLADPVWFVRLQATKALGALHHVPAEHALGERLLDANWQVRNAAAMSLAMLGGNSLDIFLGTLEFEDRYAKESICEEIQKTGYVDILIGNLSSKDGTTLEKSRNILRIMSSLYYSTPLLEYMKTGKDENVKRELETLIREPAT